MLAILYEFVQFLGSGDAGLWPIVALGALYFLLIGLVFFIAFLLFLVCYAVLWWWYVIYTLLSRMDA